jgi:UDP-glucose:(heptosyl)LPS alpha-1,3-glucosyltransferase
LGGRPDVPDFLLAADVLLHPSYHENTGTAILEAMVAGLPVLTVAACGYAHYVEEASAGFVVPAPFKQQAFNQTLQKMLLSLDITTWRQNGLIFAKQADIYSMPVRAADLIEKIGRERASTS